MNYRIGKYSGEHLKVAGILRIDEDKSISYDTHDEYLAGQLKGALEYGIKSIKCSSVIDEKGNSVFVEYDESVSPEDKSFLEAIQEALPPHYYMIDLIENSAKEQQRKTA